MQYNFCTLFDSFYLTRGVAMYKSLEQTGCDFHLYIFAFDDLSLSILKKYNFKRATIISLSEFENEKLLAVKPTRTKAEYCWTCTPSTIAYVIQKYNVDSCTYVDADLYFYKSPQPLFDEMRGKSILLTEHRYPPAFNRTNTSGIYCVQFVTFLNNEEGLKALYWWRDACIEWCYDRYEDGKFGDQKYLDDWTARFKGVHVLQHLGGGLAPWNIEQYKVIAAEGNNLQLVYPVQNNQKFEAVFYHFHYVRFFQNNLLDLGWRKLEDDIVYKIYVPYIKYLFETEKEVKAIEPLFHIPLKKFSLINNQGFRNKLKYLYKRVLRFSLYDLNKLLKNNTGN